MILNSLFIIPTSVYAASSPWTQTDWSGGVGASTTNQYSAASNTDPTTTSGQVTLSVAEKLANPAFSSDNASWSVAAVPPSGWIEVSGNATFSTTNFLSMKYEAKCAATSDPTTGLTTAANTYADSTTACTSANSRQVVSVASGNPIVNISQTTSATRCSAVSVGSTTAHLQTNNEWMTIARDIEAQGANWNGGVVGTSYVYSGHNDNGPATSLVASSDDTLGYTNTGQSSGNQKRTLTLSNGAVIWDLPGNVWEWTNDVQSTAINTTAGWVEWNHANVATGARELYGPSSASYLSASGMGQVYGGALNNAFLRGGGWNNGADAGAFTLNLNFAPSLTGTGVGFRCASDPVAISQSFSSTSGRQASGGNSVTIGSVTDGKIYQSVNVGDTSTYDFSVYVYDNTAGSEGGTVSSSVAQLYYNGATISTTYTDAGSGWWKLSGTLTGANESREYGVVVKLGKTVKVDDFSLNNYASSGTLTSSIFDSGQQSNWGTLTYSATTPSNTSVAVKVRTSANSDMTGATAFASCTAISSGADISSNSCVTDTNQYVQYQLTLANTDSISTPTFTDFSLAFSASIPSAPSSFSGSASGTTSINWSWTDNASNETGFYVQDSLGNTKCTAIANATTCNEGSLSPNTSYTRVVVAYSGSGNSSSSNSASATTRTIPSPSLNSPGNNTYTTNSRPSFTFQPSTTNTATSTYNDVSSYRLYVKDTTGNTVFSISGIPTSGTTQINNASYTISFSGFNDSDTGNNYITVQTKGSSSWGNQGKYTTSNDGNLIQGQQTWSVASVDSAGNESASNNTIYLDNTAPTVTLTSIGNISFNTNYQNWYYTQLNPTFTGSSSEQGTVTITLNKKGFNTSIFGGYGNYITANVNTDSSGNFSWTPSNLEYGEYQVIIQSKDQAGNTSQTLNFNLIVDTYQNLVNQGIFQGSQPKPTSSEQTETPEQQEPEVIQTKEGGPIIPKEPNALEKATSVIPDLIGNLYKSGTAWIPTFVGMTKEVVGMTRGVVSSVFNSIGNGIAFVFDKTVQDIAFRFNMTTQGIAFVFNKTGEGLAFVSSVNTSINGAIFHNIEIATSAIENGLYTVTNNIGQGYNNIAEHAPGVTKNILLALGNGVSTVGTTIGNGFGAVGTTSNNIADGTSSVIVSGSEAISNTGKIATSSAYGGLLAMTKGAQNGITSIAFAVGEKVQDVSGTVGIAIIKFTYNFVPEPTKISNVKILVLSPTSVKVSWLTNHPANGKVNYGFGSGDYAFEQQTDKRTTAHEFVINNLTPDTEYHYEVMSQNKNYVYDANREFKTPKEK